MTIKFPYICPSCEREVEVSFTFEVHEKTCHAPALCHPYEPPSFDPEECPHCETKLELDDVEREAVSWAEPSEP